MRTRFAFVLLLFAAQQLLAQSVSAQKPESQPATTSGSAQPDAQESAPGVLRALSRALAGKWLLRVRFEPMSELPNGLAGNGEESWRLGPGNFTLIQEEHIPTPGGQAYLLGLLWWDTKSKRLQGLECDNQAPSTCDLKGALTDITVTWDAKTLAINEIETEDGKKTVWHEAWSDITPTSFLQTGDITQPDGSTSRLMTIRATKVPD